jgi:hypothetical protein
MINRFPITLVLLFFFLPFAFGQAVTGTILGTVKDPAGVPIADASVRIVNTSTGAVRVVKTNAEGDYEAPSLPPGGPYTVNVEYPGFKKSVSTNVPLNVDQKARVDVTLEVGSVDQTVEVVAAWQRVHAIPHPV